MYGKWEKLGLIFDPRKPGLDWMKTHAQNPMPEHLGSGVYKVYFATRDAQNRSRGAYFVFDIRRPFETLDHSRRPLLDLGPLGAFDDSGVMPSGLVDHGGLRYLYYTGWSRTVDVPFAFHVGLAVSSDGGQAYERPHLAPVLGRNRHDPYITGAPYVLLEGGVFRMWYISATKWERENESAKPKHYYTIKHADSDDGFVWRTNADLCLAYEAQEYAIARPIVRRMADGYEMWFTFRGGAETYRLGVARSVDGRAWKRDSSAIGIDVSSSGWDSEMICYGCPFEHGGRLYVLYNGNAYGSTGVGLAVSLGG
jgi:hypothetical protein